MPISPDRHTVRQHFTDRAPSVCATYLAILEAAKKLGPVREDPKKTSIHLVRRTAFAGVATRRTALVLTLKSKSDLTSPRITRRERASTNRWHLEVRVDSPEQVDSELVGWLEKAYELAG